jgi:hypothetical protein
LARPTHDEIIRNLSADLAVLNGRWEEMRRDHAEIRDLQVRVAVLEHQVADLRKGWEIWVQRLWMILAPFVGASIGAVLTYVLNKK